MRFRVSPELKAAWDEMIGGRKISQQDAVEPLIQWIVRQEPLMQSMVFGQVPASDTGEVARRLLLERMGRGVRGKGRGG